MVKLMIERLRRSGYLWQGSLIVAGVVVGVPFFGLLSFWYFDTRPPFRERLVAVSARTVRPGETFKVLREFCASRRLALDQRRTLETRQKIITLPSYRIELPAGCQQLEFDVTVPADTVPGPTAYHVALDGPVNPVRDISVPLTDVALTIEPGEVLSAHQLVEHVQETDREFRRLEGALAELKTRIRALEQR
jgi:hypothetical protein